MQPHFLPMSYIGKNNCEIWLNAKVYYSQSEQSTTCNSTPVDHCDLNILNVPLVLVAMSATFWKASRNAATANTVVLWGSKQQNICSHQRQCWLGTETELLKINLIHIWRTQIKALSRMKRLMWTWSEFDAVKSMKPVSFIILWFIRVFLYHFVNPTLEQTITQQPMQQNVDCTGGPHGLRVPFETGPKASINISEKMKEITNKRRLEC